MGDKCAEKGSLAGAQAIRRNEKFLLACMLLLTFFVSSMAGWLYETIDNVFRFGGFYLREMWMLPWCPIYGAGAMVLLATLNPLKAKMEKSGFSPGSVFSVLLVSSFVVTGVVELLGSYVCDLTMGGVPWDYSQAWMNFDGRVAPEYTIKFVFLAMLLLYGLWPLMQKARLSHPRVVCSLAVSLLVLVVFDTIAENAGMWDPIQDSWRIYGINHW